MFSRPPDFFFFSFPPPLSLDSLQLLHIFLQMWCPKLDIRFWLRSCQCCPERKELLHLSHQRCLFCTSTFEAFHFIVDVYLFSDTLLLQTTFCTTSGKQIIFPSCIDEDSYWSVYYLCLYLKRQKEILSVGSPLQACQNHFDLSADSVKGLQLPQ